MRSWDSGAHAPTTRAHAATRAIRRISHLHRGLIDTLDKKGKPKGERRAARLDCLASHVNRETETGRCGIIVNRGDSLVLSWSKRIQHETIHLAGRDFAGCSPLVFRF